MPEGVKPQLGPDATGLGWVYQYYLDVDPTKAPGGGYDLGNSARAGLACALPTRQRAGRGGSREHRRLREAVSDRTQLHEDARGERVAHGSDDAVQNANLNVGGKVIEENGAEFVLRGIGLVSSTEDLELIAVKAMEGTPIYLKDIATVQIGGDFRRGALDMNGAEAVGGTVVMRTGENAKAVIERVKGEDRPNRAEPAAGVISIKPFYDRSTLIERTIDTLKHALSRKSSS
jgi:Cu(I)/Ag(I) efflux system membrane protein CusA/SilA